MNHVSGFKMTITGEEGIVTLEDDETFWVHEEEDSFVARRVFGRKFRSRGQPRHKGKGKGTPRYRGRYRSSTHKGKSKGKEKFRRSFQTESEYEESYYQKGKGKKGKNKGFKGGKGAFSPKGQSPAGDPAPQSKGK